jgi:oxygen-independent coproporphyrinogen-3 oxidase
VETVFLGGGTPSLFSPASIAHLLEGTRDILSLAPDAEITLEANPGTVEVERFRGFREAGINRLSIGIQSFADDKLKALGRIHGRDEALSAAEAALTAGFDNVNLDLMYGLPDQNVDEALADIQTAIALAPAHLSVYQLTLEPNTLFHQHPPALPDEEAIGLMQDALLDELEAGGYRQYEVSAYAKDKRQCRHNRNYWEFGDYLGIGAGAHGKISRGDVVTRTAKTRHPDAFLRNVGSDAARAAPRVLSAADLAFEFMLNALRLRDGFPVALYTARTGLAAASVEGPLLAAREKGLLTMDARQIIPTDRGRRFLNDLVALFLPNEPCQ